MAEGLGGMQNKFVYYLFGLEEKAKERRKDDNGWKGQGVGGAAEGNSYVACM